MDGSILLKNWAYGKRKMSIDTRQCTRKTSQPIDSNEENELVCVCDSQTQGKVNWSDLSRFERLDTEDEHIVLYHQVLNHVQLQCNLQVVVVVHTQRHRYAVLFSTDIDLEPQRLYRYYKARFQIEFLFRDAKQFAGLSDCQARAKAKLDFHFNASLSAVTFAKLEARHQHGNGDQAFSMASLKRRAFNQHLIDRICEHLANGQSVEKSSPDYEALCNYGIIADEAA